MFDLAGRVALVTGGSRGLGREIVRAFAERGADVLVTSRKIDNCRAVAAQVSSCTGRRIVPYGCHVGHWDEVGELVEFAYEQFGQIDVLVNNAGISPTYPSLIDATEKLWDSTFAVNLKGPFRLTALIGTRMAAGTGGSIINVSSTGSIHPNPHVAVYASAKAGLNALTVSFAHAFGPAVRVNAILPGTFRTDMMNERGEAALSERARPFALGRIGEPDEIVGAAVFLASAASSYMTGALLPVDGGSPP
jgi:NAD(P)-dependent dehydrogenase (short-subunit alcohol dehydrogenase family)